MNYRKVFIIAYVFLLTTSLYSLSIKDSIVAKINDTYIVKYDDLKTYVKDWNYTRKRKELIESYKLALHDLVLNQLKRFDFFDSGLAKNPEVKKQIVRNIAEEIRLSVFEKVFIPKYVNEQNAKKVYQNIDKEVDYCQVFVPFTGILTKTQQDSIEKIVLNIKDILKKTKKIEDIRKKIASMGYEFTDNNVATWDLELKDGVIHEIYITKTGDVKALKGFNGYYIVKATNTRKVKKESYEKMRSKIFEVLMDAYQEAYQHDFEEYKNNLFDEKSISWNEKVFEKVLAWANIPNFFVSMYSDTLDNAIKKYGNEVILTFNGGRVDYSEYKRLLENVLTINSQDSISAKFLKDFFKEVIRADLVVKNAKEYFKEDEFYNPLVKNIALKHRIAYVYNQTMIEDKIPPVTEESLQKFYNENMTPFYYQLEKKTIYARIYGDSIKAAEEIKAIKNGTTFEKYSNSYWVKTYERQKDGSLKSYLSTEPPYLAEAAFKLQLNEVAGPIKYIDKEKGVQYAVIMCAEIRPEKQLTYQDVRGRIREDFIEYHRERLSSEIEKYLFSKYKVEFFPNTLNSFFDAAKK